MKSYTKALPNTRSVNHSENPYALEATKCEALVVSSNVGLIETHVLELKSPETEETDNFINNSFKEWEQWLNTIELRHSQIRYKYRTTYTPTDFAKIATPDNAYA